MYAVGISFARGTVLKGKPTEPSITVYVECAPFSILTLDHLFFQFVRKDLVSVGWCPVFWPVAWSQLEGKLMGWFGITLLVFPVAFLALSQISRPSQGRESPKVTGSILIQEEHFVVNESGISVHLFHPAWRNEGFHGS